MSHSPASSNGKVALVTGSSRGIGKACIERLADTHQGLVIHCRRTPELAEGVADACAPQDIPSRL